MDFIQLIAFILPAYAANAVPVLFSGRTKVDLGKKFVDGKRVFGEGKTLRGFLAGVFSGTLVGAAVAFFSGTLFLPQFSFYQKLALAFLLSFGALTGDLVGSFIKRRLGYARGNPFFTDQFAFLLTALLFASVFYLPSFQEIVFLTALTFILHLSFNFIAFKFGVKKVPW